MRPRVQRYRRRLARPIGSACVAPKNGSAAGERQSTSSRRPAASASPSRPTYTGSASSAPTMRPRHRSRPKRRRVRRRLLRRRASRSRSTASWPRRTGALRTASRRSDTSATVCSRLRAMAAKCSSSPAINAGSALAARRSGRSNTLVVRAVPPDVVSSADQYAPAPGPCGKAPSVRYPESGERGCSPFPCRRGAVPRLRDGYAGRMADAAPPTPDFAIAVAQFAPGADAEANLAEITRLTELAAARGARLVVFPEYSSYFTPEPGWDWPAAAERVDGRFTEHLSALATRLDVHVVAGMIERLDGDERRVANTVVAVAPGAGVVARYRKLHLYDAFGQRESDWVGAGRDRGARDVRGRRHPLRPADLLRRAVPRGDPSHRRRGRRRRVHARRVGARAAQGGALAGAHDGARHREHHVRRRGRPRAAGRVRATA